MFLTKKVFNLAETKAMKKIIVICLLLSSYIGFSQDENYNFCRKMITGNKAYAVQTKFYFNQPITNNELDILKSLLLVKKSIYDIEVNSKKTELFVYHLSQVHFEDIKILIQSSGIELNFISTQNTHFGESIHSER